jgi:hypothetical protein
MTEEEAQQSLRLVGYCQLSIRVATGVIMGAFLLIIGLTTASTGAFVQVAAKILYYIIVASAIFSVFVWFFRTRVEKRIRIPRVL